MDIVPRDLGSAPAPILLNRALPSKVISSYQYRFLGTYSSVFDDYYVIGVPVVGSRLGGTPELIREGETGYLFPAGEPEALAEKILLHFASSVAERRRTRQNCIREARTRLAPEPGVEAMLAVYREALTQGEEPRQGG